MARQVKPQATDNGTAPAIELPRDNTIRPALTLEEAAFIHTMIQQSTLPYSTVAIAQSICAKLEALAPQEA